MPSLVDPRVAALDLSVAREVYDRGLRHAIFLERWKGGVASRVLSALDREVIPAVVGQAVARAERIAQLGIDYGPVVTSRLNEMSTELGVLVKTRMAVVQAGVAEELVAGGKAEAAWQVEAMRGALATAVAPPGISAHLLSTPSTATIRAAVTSRPFQGRILKDWFDRIGDQGIREALMRETRIGLSLGETIDQIARRYRGTGAFGGVVGRVRRDAVATARTAATHVAAKAREATYEENQDVVKAVQFVATLDERTTDICGSLDQEEFPVESGPRPPMHHQCRSTTIPVLRTLAELGLPTKGRPPTEPTGTRPSKGPNDAALGKKDGQIPAGISYEKWLRAQPPAFQNEILGTGRAEVFRRGQLPLKRFLDHRYRPLSLRELQALEKRVAAGGGTVPRKPAPIPKAPKPAAPPPPPLSPTAPPPETKLASRGAEVRTRILDVTASRTAAVDELKRRGLLLLDKLDAMPTPTTPMSVGSADPARAARDAVRKEMVRLGTIEIKARISIRKIVLREITLPEPMRGEVGYRYQVPTGEKKWQFFTAKGNKYAVKEPDFVDAKSVQGRLGKDVKEARAFLSSVVDRRVLSLEGEESAIRVQVRRTAVKRSYFMERDDGGSIYMSKSEHRGAKILIHETGHALEWNRERVGAAARAFYERRTAGEEAVRLQDLHPDHGYQSDEWTKKDKFPTDYWGKVYEGGATEITSMALEALYNDPVKLMREDPDAFEWILDLIRGHLQ
uniref:Putative capsid morphogenesis protein n=1 Tax=viral metagenome TaxID=1070528 RepID=A0A6M3JAS8_9ZZZZ